MIMLSVSETVADVFGCDSTKSSTSVLFLFSYPYNQGSLVISHWLPIHNV